MGFESIQFLNPLKGVLSLLTVPFESNQIMTSKLPCPSTFSSSSLPSSSSSLPPSSSSLPPSKLELTPQSLSNHSILNSQLDELDDRDENRKLKHKLISNHHSNHSSSPPPPIVIPDLIPTRALLKPISSSKTQPSLRSSHTNSHFNPFSQSNLRPSTHLKSQRTHQTIKPSWAQSHLQPSQSKLTNSSLIMIPNQSINLNPDHHHHQTSLTSIDRDLIKSSPSLTNHHLEPSSPALINPQTLTNIPSVSPLSLSLSL